MVYEARWPNPRLRVELQRCQSSRSCLVRQNFPAWSSLVADCRSRATFRVFKLERKIYGTEDLPFLERVFQKLLLNFTWSVRLYSSSISCSSDLEIGGLTARIKVVTMSLKAVSLGSIILGPSTARSHCLLAVLYVKLMVLLGWRSTVLTCESKVCR